MSLLSYYDLCDLVAGGVIGPVPHDHINAASIDVRLGPDIFTEHNTGKGVVSLRDREQLSGVVTKLAEGSHYDLRPGEFILAHTMETFNLPLDIAAEFKLKSSGARVGLENALATWCDQGWRDSVLTLELKNLTQFHTIRLRPGDKIGQMLFYRTTPVPLDRSYTVRGRYNGDSSFSQCKP